MGRPLLAVIAAALLCAGCDTGGLLSVDHHDAGPEIDAGPTVLGPATNDMVNAGTVVQNGKYKLVYTFGQATPNQGPAVGKNNRDNGGLVGAMEGK